jgi:hypothetical protein
MKLQYLQPGTTHHRQSPLALETTPRGVSSQDQSLFRSHESQILEGATED